MNIKLKVTEDLLAKLIVQWFEEHASSSNIRQSVVYSTIRDNLLPLGKWNQSGVSSTIHKVSKPIDPHVNNKKKRMVKNTEIPPIVKKKITSGVSSTIHKVSKDRWCQLERDWDDSGDEVRVILSTGKIRYYLDNQIAELLDRNKYGITEDHLFTHVNNKKKIYY